MTNQQQNILFSSDDEKQTFANFYGRGNQLLKEKLISYLHSADSFVGYLYGETGMGKTHLLKSCTHFSRQANNTQSCHIYINYHELNAALSETIRESVQAHYDEHPILSETSIVVVVDDLTDVFLSSQKQHEAELALLSLYELLKKMHDEASHLGGLVKLICSSSKPPKKMAFSHKDLQTRLSTAVVYSIVYADDIEKQEIIKMVALRRGIVIKTDAVDYIFNHYSRRLPNLMALVNQLDALSLQQQRKITIPLVKQAIAMIAS